jgi:hypothetical protein
MTHSTAHTQYSTHTAHIYQGSLSYLYSLIEKKKKYMKEKD